jgi:hypothetical protein
MSLGVWKPTAFEAFMVRIRISELSVLYDSRIYLPPSSIWSVEVTGT